MPKRALADKLPARVQQLLAAAEAADARLPAPVVAQAQRVVNQVDRRLAFAGEDTVVALAGATGSGKSSLFNAISGTRLAEPGMKRPTTRKAMAAYWGDRLPSELLDWLDVPRRHLVRGDIPAMNGLILLDLPDHDSTVTTNRMEVDRLVQLVDMLIWVVDPQKYADALLHNSYLKPLAHHADVMLVALNQADRLTPAQLRETTTDLRRLLDTGGLAKTQIVATSALTGMGVDELRAVISTAVTAKQAAALRLAADVSRAAEMLSAEFGEAKVAQKVPDAVARQLNRSLAEAAGTEIIRDAVAQSVRHRGVLATGWPLTAWLSRLRPDPLRMLHLGRSPSSSTKELAPVAVPRTSLPTAGGVQQARVDSALRGLAEASSAGLPEGFVAAVRQATLAHRHDLTDELDQTVATADLGADQGHGWWRVVRVLQWLILLTAVVGAGWLVADLVLAYLQLPPLPTGPVAGRLRLPAVLLLGGGLGGLLVGLASRAGIELDARAKAARAERIVTRAVAEVADQLVIAPVNKELVRFHQGRTQADQARN